MNRVTDVIWKDQRLKEGMALFESFTRNLTDVSSFCIFAQNNKKKEGTLQQIAVKQNYKNN